MKLIPLDLSLNHDKMLSGSTKAPNQRQEYPRSKGKPFVNLSSEAARQRLEEDLKANAARPLFTGTAEEAPEILPHVYTSSSFSQGNIISHLGSKYLLPIDTTRTEHEDYEEVVIPPAKPVPPRTMERLIPVTELDHLAQGSFSGYSSLNRIQSIVYSTAYSTNENMLICAPTGAGKTDVAMLTILRVIDQHRSSSTKTSISSTIRHTEFKIIYVAPMKALASEIVRKLGKRLKWLSIRVRELTGDMQLTKAEIAETQIIVTTPEKWDVVTRKPTGEGDLVSMVKLLIIDEVHLLNEDRGAVIETIVARTLRMVESTQSLIRIVGLSATLPNYLDVADFLRVSHHKGLFFFDSSFRPIPLEQHFLGIKGKPGSQQSRKNLDRVTYEKVAALVNQGHQVMVFVHARKETVKAAMALKDSALTDGSIDEFSCQDHPTWSLFRRDIATSRNKEMKQLFDHGFGIHHAGMLRSDRNLMERLFEARAIKVLCCTATLAWGVNLPAHAVVIKGTQLYDSAHGKFVDLSVLDVLQIFGRAGRPGLETSGEGYICTTEDKLTHYLDAVTAQNPIESQFINGMDDSLNAEIALGTVANITEAVQWIGYTYLFVRMRKNPFLYGMAHDVRLDDPQLGQKRLSLVREKGRRLAEAGMVNFDDLSDTFAITDLGRIAAKYYIRAASIEIFNKEFRHKMTEADVLYVLSLSTEFNQIQLRENEVDELKSFMDNEDIVPCQVRGGTDTSQGKVNILLQAYISRRYPEDFALVSDMAYVAQNAGRIIRALLEISLSRKWAEASAVLLAMSKAVEKRMWPFENPLGQLEKELHTEVLYNVRRWADELSISELASKSAAELGQLIRLNERHGVAVLKAAKHFPTVDLSYELRPLTTDLLQITAHVRRSFEWGSRPSNAIEPFWLWIEGHDSEHILQLANLAFRQSTTVLDADFIIKIPAGESVTIRYVSDRWLGAEDEAHISLEDLIMPSRSSTFTQLLTLPFLMLDVVHDEALIGAMSPKIGQFNGIQTHCFWNIINSNQNALLCAPPSSGKSTMGYILALKTVRKMKADEWVLILSPKQSLVGEVVVNLTPFAGPLGIAVFPIVTLANIPAKKSKTIWIVTPRVLSALLFRKGAVNFIDGLRLVLCENLQLLDAEYELAVSALIHITQNLPVRFVGISDSLADPGSLATWLHVRSSASCIFKPSDREQALITVIQSFTIPQSMALLRAMVKPAHAAIQSAGAGGNAIIFVPSRGQCKVVAADLITQCAMANAMQGYLPGNLSVDDIEPYLARLQDHSLLDLVARGIGIFHEGISKNDRSLFLELYAEGVIRVLLVPRESCWSLRVRAAVVVVMGTQYIQVDDGNEDRRVKDYSLAEIMRMEGRAIHHMRSSRFYLFCQAEHRETLSTFLKEGGPLESTLQTSPVLQQWYSDRLRDGSILDKQQGIDALSFTFLARRMACNPLYYDANPGGLDESLSRLVDKLHTDVGPS
ncbi:Sec63-domain-containing protein [Rickenella mellea]|uniref:Sec63-domain-containing protein n=1 Tax=Rickenella mellea TaxID=50990 RepID=A0A4R5XFZ4_9AGAM|nr:Sec63-domain-containing protein [Rickenella mellea]